MVTSTGFWNGKRVLITGHTGFKGSWLALWLTHRGAKVMGFSLPAATTPSHYETTGLAKRTESILSDIRDYSSFKKHYEAFQPEIVFHMAAQALVRPSYKDPVGTYATNVMGTVHVLDTARLVPSARVVVNVTSDKCYENREWAWGYRENEPMGGHDPYSNSKGCSELITSAFQRSYFGPQGIGLGSGRAGNVIGGGDWSEDRLIPDCMKALTAGKPIQVRNPDSIRPWQHVLEPLAGYIRLAEKLWQDPKRYSTGFNFGPEASDAKPVHWIADRMVSLWGKDAKWEHVALANQPHEAHYLKLDCSLAHSELGWRPRLSLSKTLEWVTDWYRHYASGKSAFELTLRQIEEYEKLEEAND